MKKIKFSAWVLVTLMILSGCANIKLIAKYDSDSVEPHHATRYSYFWGLKSPTDIEAKCDSKSICKVKTRVTVPQVLITTFTLGIVIPQNIEWECCRPAIRENKLD